MAVPSEWERRPVNKRWFKLINAGFQLIDNSFSIKPNTCLNVFNGMMANALFLYSFSEISQQLLFKT